MLTHLNRFKIPNVIDSNTKASIIDLGSNSMKMINYNVDSHDSYKPYHRESIRVKLTECMSDGTIPDSHITNTIESLKLFRNIIDFEQIEYVIAVATSAMRDATNQEQIIQYIKHETGFDFKILSEHEEAIYSYAGAIRSLKIPTTVFFDIGGGSLEMVSANNFEIKKVMSMPLGALRLTQQFGGRTKSEKDISMMQSHINESLPTREALGISDGIDHVLVGVGGTLRKIAKYHQQMIHYPLSKVHNYSMSYESLKSISDELLSGTSKDISRIESIVGGNTHIIQVGALIISEIVRKLGFTSLVISAQGLREGTLSLSLQFPDDFATHTIDVDHVRDLIHMSCQSSIVSEYVEDLVQLLFTMNLLTNKERILLAEAILQINRLSAFRDVNNILYTMLDEDSELSHREQLIVALSLIYSQKKKKAEMLMDKFKDILNGDDKKIIKKIAVVVSLCDIFHKTRTHVKPRTDTTSTLVLDIYPSTNKFPKVLMLQVCSKMANVLGIPIKPEIYYK